MRLPPLLVVVVLLMASSAVDRATGHCDFDERWSYEARPCSAWSVHDDANSTARRSRHFVLLTGSRVSADDHALLPLTDHSQGTATGARATAQPCMLVYGLTLLIHRVNVRGVVGRGRATFFRQGTRPPLAHFFGLKFVQKLVRCCDWLLTETLCKIMSVQQN